MAQNKMHQITKQRTFIKFKITKKLKIYKMQMSIASELILHRCTLPANAHRSKRITKMKPKLTPIIMTIKLLLYS
jgi:hypothetical protein